MIDIAYIAGLIIANLHFHPFPYCDVVTATTHKTLRGPRERLILSKIKDRLNPKGKFNLAEKKDRAVFPEIQGGPLEHVIAAKAVCFLEAMKPSFREYQKQIILNAKAMADEFIKQGIRVISGGTDNHLIVIDISLFNLETKKFKMSWIKWKSMLIVMLFLSIKNLLIILLVLNWVLRP